MTGIKAFLKLILYKPLYNALIFLVWLIPGHSVGWAIVTLTVLIRLLLLPSSKKSIESQKQLKELQPELDKIKEKYKDKQEQAKATMAFYTSHKINPLSSCLPLLIQFPILIILYYVFRAGLDTSRFGLLYNFVPRPDAMNTMFLGINLTVSSIYLAVIAGILQFIQTKQIMPKSQPAVNSANKDDKTQQVQNMFGSQMLYIMPIFTVFISMKLPAALPLYWAVTTLFAIGQQYFVLKQKDTQKVSVLVREK